MALPALMAAGALLRGGLTAATVAPLVKPAVGFVKRFFTRPTARPGIGSKVTKGPLRVGGQVLYGPKPAMSTAAKVASAIGAAGVGLGTVASHRSSSQRSAATSPAPRRSAPRASSTQTDRKCCPAGTKRMVCFKRGRVKGTGQTGRASRKRRGDKASRAEKREAKRVRRQRGRARRGKDGGTAKQRAARARFAAAARRGPIRKGTRL